MTPPTKRSNNDRLSDNNETNPYELYFSVVYYFIYYEVQSILDLRWVTTYANS